MVHGDGSRTQTISLRNADGSLRSQTTKTLSSDGRAQTVASDLDGDGAADRVQTIAVTVAADGSSTSTSTTRSRTGALIGRETTATSANGLVRQQAADLDGNGTVDRTVTDTSVVQAEAAGRRRSRPGTRKGSPCGPGRSSRRAPTDARAQPSRTSTATAPSTGSR